MTEPEFRELPTPQPLTPGPSVEVGASFLERLERHRKLLLVVVAAGLIVAVLAAVLILTRGRGGDEVVLEASVRAAGAPVVRAGQTAGALHDSDSM